MQFPKIKPYRFTDMEQFKRDATALINSGAGSVLVAFPSFIDFDGMRTQLSWGGVEHFASEDLTILIKFPR